MKAILILLSALVVISSSCSKDDEKSYRYFEVGFNGTAEDWRDSAFVVATADLLLVNKVLEQLQKPVSARQILMGKIISGNGGYNKNATHNFTWHYKEDEWELVDVSAEIYDGRPYSDLDKDPDYWLGTLKRFSPWGSYIRKKILRE